LAGSGRLQDASDETEPDPPIPCEPPAVDNGSSGDEGDPTGEAAAAEECGAPEPEAPVADTSSPEGGDTQSPPVTEGADPADETPEASATDESSEEEGQSPQLPSESEDPQVDSQAALVTPDTEDRQDEDETPQDPFFVRGSVTHRFLTSCTGQPVDPANTCTVSSAPIQAAVNDVASNGAPDDHTIKVEAGSYSGNVTVNGSLSSNLSGLTLQTANPAGIPRILGSLWLQQLSGFALLGFRVDGWIYVTDSSDVQIQGTPLNIRARS